MLVGSRIIVKITIVYRRPYLHFTLSLFSAVCSLVLVSLCSLSGAVDVCSLSGAVDVKVQDTKPVGSSDDKFQLKGSCTYQMTGRVDAKGVVLTVQFDKDTMKFKVFAN